MIFSEFRFQLICRVLTCRLFLNCLFTPTANCKLRSITALVRNGNFAMIFTVPWALACNYYGVLVRLCFFASHMVEVGDGGLNPIRINRPWDPVLSHCFSWRVDLNKMQTYLLSRLSSCLKLYLQPIFLLGVAPEMQIQTIMKNWGLKILP